MVHLFHQNSGYDVFNSTRLQLDTQLVLETRAFIRDPASIWDPASIRSFMLCMLQALRILYYQLTWIDVCIYVCMCVCIFEAKCLAN